jgi:hypothetical protein
MIGFFSLFVDGHYLAVFFHSKERGSSFIRALMPSMRVPPL